MSRTTNTLFREGCLRAVGLVLDQEDGDASRWAVSLSIAPRIGCSGQTLDKWVRRAEVDAGKRSGMPTDLAAKPKTAERKNRELRQVRAGGRGLPRRAFAGIETAPDGDVAERLKALVC